ncbi:MAG: hypothetical protein ACYSU7_17530 [Planctomycetota bacterium]|jgi:hypothetical protein
MPGSQRTCTAGIVAGLLLTAAAAADVVERRGAAPPIEGEVTAVDDGGVTVRSALGAVHFIAWDRVRRVETDLAVPALSRRMATAVELWRARSRVERNDTTLAEPLLERLFERYRGRTHETALVVAEGLLRCRIARADHVLAIVPALEVARLRRAGVTTEVYAALNPVFDDRYGLCTVLTPVWLPSPLLESLAHELGSYDAGPDGETDEVVGGLARLYRHAVLQAMARGGDGPTLEAMPDHPGVELLGVLNGCSDADPARRRAARARLTRMIPSLPGWAEAWARFHIGRSLVAEDDIARKQEGAVSLVHVPARFGRSQTFLAGLALAYASRALDEAGATDDATDLRAELGKSYPRHPLHSIGVMRLGPQPGPAAGSVEENE